MKTFYISQLSQPIQQAIQSEVTLALSQLDLTPSEQSQTLQDALNSRLCDLSDLININKYIN
ncbi:hypothetical protein [Cytobacillus praedii]|uniref:Uncharacterized protein n=1 Tax=Cytobacillus praedii TaxID=1742358 RepID=A0A4R1ARE3_9BACI|nr:hypothetical protein [Cytobacillus praedii]TCI99982.1 hypothetical protein E0Y62_27095 [Cytobacillus praedii]